MDEQSGESDEEEVMGKGIGKSETEELVYSSRLMSTVRHCWNVGEVF